METQTLDMTATVKFFDANGEILGTKTYNLKDHYCYDAFADFLDEESESMDNGNGAAYWNIIEKDLEKTHTYFKQ